MWNGSPVNSLMIGLPLLRMMPGISTLAVRRSKFASRLIGRNNVSQNSEQVDAGSSTLNRGHEHQRLIGRCNAREGRPHCFGGTQRGSGTGNDNSACIVQPWSVIPAAMAGVGCCV